MSETRGRLPLVKPLKQWVIATNYKLHGTYKPGLRQETETRVQQTITYEAIFINIYAIHSDRFHFLRRLFKVLFVKDLIGLDRG